MLSSAPAGSSLVCATTCLDNLVGMDFAPPLGAAPGHVEAINAYEPIDLRAAVDLPTERAISPAT